MTSTVEFKCRHQNLFILSQQSCWFENQKQQKKNTSFLHCFTWERLPCVLTLISLSFSLQSFVRTFPSLLLHVGNTILSKHSSKRWPAIRWYIWTTTSKLMERHVQETLISLSAQERKTKDILRKQKIGFCFLQKMWTLHNTQDYATRTIERYQKQTEAFIFFLFRNRNLHGQVLCTDRHSLLFFLWGRKGIVNSLLSTIIPFATESKSSLMLSTLPALESLMCTKLVKMMLFKKVLKFQKTSFCCRGHF